jgi:hypothetical protein
MELAANRKELETRQAEIAQRSHEFERVTNMAVELLAAQLPQQPDMSLLNTDPIGYMQQKGAYDQHIAQLQQIVGAKQQHAQQQQAEQQQAMQTWAQGEAEALVTAMPELKQPEKARQFHNDIVKLGETYGFTPAEIAGNYDHRYLLMARDLLKMQSLMAAKPKALDKAKDAPPVQKPGARSSQNEAGRQARKEKMDRLRQTGSLNDGASVIRDLIKG